MRRVAIEPHPGMSQAVRRGRQVFLAGQVALDEGGRLVGEGDAQLQCEQIFRNIERLLAKAGASLDDVTLLTCYLTDARHFPAYAEAKRRRFPVDPPAGTSVIVAGLLDPRFLLEVEVVAVIEAEEEART
jgi:enamine deaminase RidA (YjgF/YER057c/UK114 family)